MKKSVVLDHQAFALDEQPDVFFEIGGINKRIWAGRCRNSIDFFHPCFFLASTPLALQGSEILQTLSARLPIKQRPGGVSHSVAGDLFAVTFPRRAGITAVRFLPQSISGRGAATNRLALFGGLCLLDHPDGRIATTACFALAS